MNQKIGLRPVNGKNKTRKHDQRNQVQNAIRGSVRQQIKPSSVVSTASKHGSLTLKNHDAVSPSQILKCAALLFLHFEKQD